MNDQVSVVTIDGPSGAGKGTVCTLVARKLGYALLDSGALYRLTALAAMKQKADLDNQEAIAAVARTLDVNFRLDSESDGMVSVILVNEDVTTAIRDELVGMNASIVAAYPRVRSALLDRQRAFAKAPGLVADGRDMGTVVFPWASVKIFLTASAEERANRRVLQLARAGHGADRAAILADILARDERDSSRLESPLKPADDAVLLDSTSMSIEEVVDAVLTQVKLKC